MTGRKVEESLQRLSSQAPFATRACQCIIYISTPPAAPNMAWQKKCLPHHRMPALIKWPYNMAARLPMQSRELCPVWLGIPGLTATD